MSDQHIDTADEFQSDADLTDEVRQLKIQIGRLRTALREQTVQTRRRTTLLTWLLTLVALIGALLGIFTIQTTSNNADAIAESNRRWCPVIQPFAPKPGDPPPVGDPEQVQRALRIRRAFANLVADFGCK